MLRDRVDGELTMVVEGNGNEAAGRAGVYIILSNFVAGTHRVQGFRLVCFFERVKTTECANEIVSCIISPDLFFAIRTRFKDSTV